jgi:hypothetical protein
MPTMLSILVRYASECRLVVMRPALAAPSSEETAMTKSSQKQYEQLSLKWKDWELRARGRLAVGAATVLVALLFVTLFLVV